MPNLDTLPPEIRLNIYKLLLPTTSISWVGATQQGEFAVELEGELRMKSKARGIWPSMGNVTKVLGVCRLFDRELSPLVYRSRLFYLRNAPESLSRAAQILKHLRPENAQLIRGFVINYTILNYAEIHNSCNWTTVKDRSGGQVIEKPELVEAKAAFCEAAAHKLKFLSLRVETRNCQWLTAATLTSRAGWLAPFLQTPGIEDRRLCIMNPQITRVPDNETRSDYRKRIEKQLHVEGLLVRVEPPGESFFAGRQMPALNQQQHQHQPQPLPLFPFPQPAQLHNQQQFSAWPVLQPQQPPPQ